MSSNHDDGWESAAGQNRFVSGRSDDDPPQIQHLLDLGYEQLDGFVAWQEESQGISSRIAQQNCFNAESLIDYLANYHQKSAADINEFELRWFMHSHYIRKAMADAETELRLPFSIHLFYQYLKAKQLQTPPDWLPSILEDTGDYQKRRQHYHLLDDTDEAAWEEGYREWCLDLEDDLDARCLWMPRDIAEGIQWGVQMGWRESTLFQEANRNWQQKREELMRSGGSFDVIREQLIVEYLQWLDTPQRRLEEQSPREVIAMERMERLDEEDPGTDAEAGDRVE